MRINHDQTYRVLRINELRNKDDLVVETTRLNGFERPSPGLPVISDIVLRPVEGWVKLSDRCPTSEDGYTRPGESTSYVEVCDANGMIQWEQPKFITSPGKSWTYWRSIRPPTPPPIQIGEHIVQFQKGGVKVGCTYVDNARVRQISSRLQD